MKKDKILIKIDNSNKKKIRIKINDNNDYIKFLYDLLYFEKNLFLQLYPFWKMTICSIVSSTPNVFGHLALLAKEEVVSI